MERLSVAPPAGRRCLVLTQIHPANPSVLDAAHDRRCQRQEFEETWPAGDRGQQRDSRFLTAGRLVESH